MRADGILCLVTDRRRLTPGEGAAGRPSHERLLEQIAGAIAGGIDLVQIREPDLTDSGLLALTRAVVSLARGSPARVLVNDRLDVALAAGVAGVHLRGDSIDARTVRRLAPPMPAGGAWLLGRSIHQPPEAGRAGPVDFFIAGTVFPTSAKPGLAAFLGLEGLRETARAAQGVPVLAIGGVREAHVPALRAAGAKGLAAIGLFQPPSTGANLASAVRDVAIRLRFAFDS